MNVLLAVSAAAILLARLVTRFYPHSRWWGINHLAYFPVSFAIAYFLVVLAVLFAIPDKVRAPHWAKKWPQWLKVSVVSIIVLLSFHFVRDRANILGDGGLRLVEIRNRPFSTLYENILPEPLDYTLHFFAYRLIAAPLGGDPLIVFQVISYVAGLAFFWLAYLFCTRLKQRKGTREAIIDTGIFLPLVHILSWGGILMFFGYAENYALAAVAILGFFSHGLYYLQTGRKIGLLVALFLIGFFCHNFVVILLPSLCYLLFQRLATDKKRTLVSLLLIFFLVGGWLALCIGKRGHGTLLLPEAASEPGYYLLGKAHLLDMLNELLLVSPALVLLLWLQRIVFRQPDQRKITVFFWLPAVAGLAILFFVDPQLGMARDWDLFSLALLPFHLALFMNADWQKASRCAKNAVVVISLSGTGLWVLLNASESRSLARYENIVALENIRARYGFERLGNHLSYKKRWPEAVRAFRMAIAKKPHFRCYLGIAYAELQMNQKDEAAENYQKALELDPNNIAALYNLGVIHLENKRWREAKEMFSRLLQQPGSAPKKQELTELLKKLDQLMAKEDTTRHGKTLPQSQPSEWK